MFNLQNSKILKTILLIAGALLIVFCYFMDVAKFVWTTKNVDAYYTFSGKVHISANSVDQYQSIPDCNGNGFCKTAKWTPYLAGFMIGFCGLVLFIQLCEDILSRKIKKFHLWIIQLVLLFLAWLFILLLPILYFTTKQSFDTLCVLPLIFEFVSIGCLSAAFFFYYQGNSSKGTGLLS